MERGGSAPATSSDGTQEQQSVSKELGHEELVTAPGGGRGQQRMTCYRVVSNAALRDRCERRGSKKVGSLVPGTVVTVLEKSVNSRGQARLRTAAGWISLVARDGTVLLEDMKIDASDHCHHHGVVPDEDIDRSAREDLAADMTAWLLDHPDGDLDGWRLDSEWVRSLGSSPHGPCVPSRCWQEVFAEQQRQMDLVPFAVERQPTGRLDFDELRAIGREWAVASMICDEERIVEEPLTAPAAAGGTDSLDDSRVGLGPTTWSDVRDAAAAAAKAMVAADSITPKSAAVSTVSSPRSRGAVSPITAGPLSPACSSTSPITIDNGTKEDDRDGGEDNDTGEWTYLDASAWMPSAGDTDWEIVNDE